MPKRDMNEDMNAIERDRYERRMATRRRGMLTNIIVVAVIAAIIIAIIAVAVSMGKKDNEGDADPSAAATTATVAQPTAATSAATQQQSTQNGSAATQQQQYLQSTDVQIQQNTQPASEAAGDNSTTAPAETPTGAPAVQGGVLHYYANGQTSYGYDWTYSGGGGLVNVDCKYDFDTDTYDFIITGVSEGTSDLTLYYNTDDGVQVPVYMTVNVDSSLNVTQN